MQIRDHLAYMIRVNKTSAAGFLGNITEEESMNRIDGRFNHIRWLAGHMLYYAGWILSQLRDDYREHEQIAPLFARGTSVSDNPDDYPTLAELKKRLDDTYEAILEALIDASDSDLEKAIAEGNKKPLWESITFYCMHNFYHTGQVMYNRRAVGKKWPFGG